MDRSRKKRLRRIESIDQKRLDVAIGKLKKANQTLELRRQLQTSMQLGLNESLKQVQNADSVMIKNHAIEWAAKTQSSLSKLREHLMSLEKIRDELLDDVGEQRAKVKGWEILLEKIESEELASIEKESIYQADDRFLGKLTAKNGSSE